MPQSKMESYKLININNKNHNWKIIEEINWCKLIEKYPNYPYDKVGEYLKENYTINEIINLEKFFVNKRKELQNELIKCNITDSDDELWDLSSHITALGENVYNLCMKYNEIANIIKNETVENFEYGFTKAVFDLKNTEYNNEA